MSPICKTSPYPTPEDRTEIDVLLGVNISEPRESLPHWASRAGPASSHEPPQSSPRERVRRAARHQDAPSLSDLLAFGALLMLIALTFFAYAISSY